MSKPERELKAMRQAQRAEAARRQKAAERRSLLIIVGVLAAAALAISITALYLYNSTPRHLTFQPVAQDVGQVVPSEGQQHVQAGTQVTYQHQPPTSGSHYSQAGLAPVAWQTIGTLQPEVWVHNLEHGGIVVLYNCPTGCDNLQKQLTTYVNSIVPAEPQYGEYKIILSPYSQGMGTHKVALLAWGRIEFLDGYDQAKITQFYEARVDQGPERIP
ncbi:MAG TPA: DUF3105 domain-containing protein [Candidatus Dormibacteraeota bacterium]|nr:DUF3105 domain-containing protein [Candidatus Dormibacteraeota bacterium]